MLFFTPVRPPFLRKYIKKLRETNSVALSRNCTKTYPFQERNSVQFYNSAITKTVICARIVVEMGSHLTKRFLFNHTTHFSTKSLGKSWCDFTGTTFEQCENPVFCSQVPDPRVRCSLPPGPDETTCATKCTIFARFAWSCSTKQKRGTLLLRTHVFSNTPTHSTPACCV